MKATLSRDGAMRLTITVKYRVCLEDLVNVLGWKIVTSRGMFDGNIAMIVESELKAFNSKRAILIAFKEVTKSTGHNAWTWTDGVHDKVCEEIRKQATVLVLKKFKNLNKTPVPA